MASLSEVRRAWLADFDWAAISAANAHLCGRTHSMHKPSSGGHDQCRDLWNSVYNTVISFREALEVLFRCHRKAPFCFNNGNTFAAVARELIMDLDLSAPDKAAARSAAGHYVAGVLRGDELDAVLSSIEVPAGN